MRICATYHIQYKVKYLTFCFNFLFGISFSALFCSFKKKAERMFRLLPPPAKWRNWHIYIYVRKCVNCLIWRQKKKHTHSKTSLSWKTPRSFPTLLPFDTRAFIQVCANFYAFSSAIDFACVGIKWKIQLDSTQAFKRHFD